MKLRITLTLLIAVNLIHQVVAQRVVTRNDSVEVYHGSKKLVYPWVGGLNSAHVSEFDFNRDGKKDLFVFEPDWGYSPEICNKILPMINKGTPNVRDYEFDPTYRNIFPALNYFALIYDYNCDGYGDIFTINETQGIRVFKNDGVNPQSFTMVADKLISDTSDYPPYFAYTNEIFWNTEDMPTFADIDGDGDMDILTVDRYGFYVEYHKNLSMEKYGNCNHLDFKVRNACWGLFAEDNFVITLDTCHGYNVANPEHYGGKTPVPTSTPNQGGGEKGMKHSNTSLLAIDLNGDGVKDLLSGDGARGGLYSYINGGKKDSSHIVSYTLNYPSSNPFDEFIYAMPFYAETDNDNKKDLIVSVRQDNMADLNSVWLYKNTGSTSNPNFVLQTKGFLQDEMIDIGTKSHPVFFDYDGDSLLDIIIGGGGNFESFGWGQGNFKSSLAYYHNIGGLQSPKFELVTLDLDSISKLNLDSTNNKPAMELIPTFGDLDSDGDQDMLIGDRNGKIHYFRNNPIGGQARFTLVSRELDGIDVGDNASPFLFDIDNDQILDLFVGELYGRIFYYQGTSSLEPLFVWKDSTLGDVKVKDFYWDRGYSVPFFFRDSLDEVKLLVGTRYGWINYYDSIVVNEVIQPKFTLLEETYQNIWDGYHSTIYGGDLNNDNSLDFVFGNQSGGITLYTSEDSIYIPGIEKFNAQLLKLRLFPNPTNGDLYVEIAHGGSSSVTYSIYDLTGHLITSAEGVGRIHIDTRPMADGVYIIKAENKNRSVNLTERFVKSR